MVRICPDEKPKIVAISYKKTSLRKNFKKRNSDVLNITSNRLEMEGLEENPKTLFEPGGDLRLRSIIADGNQGSHRSWWTPVRCGGSKISPHRTDVYQVRSDPK